MLFFYAIIRETEGTMGEVILFLIIAVLSAVAGYLFRYLTER